MRLMNEQKEKISSVEAEQTLVNRLADILVQHIDYLDNKNKEYEKESICDN